MKYGIHVFNSFTNELFEIERVDTYPDALEALRAYSAASPQDAFAVLFNGALLTFLGSKKGLLLAR